MFQKNGNADEKGVGKPTILDGQPLPWNNCNQRQPRR